MKIKRKIVTAFPLIDGLDVIHWPRGKYNGMRIEGVKLTFAIHVLAWLWMPLLRWNFGEPVFIWLCFTVRGYVEYEYRVR
jgi:hypothetical protein